MRGTKYGRQGKNSKLLSFFTTFLKTFILVISLFDSSEGDFGLVQKRRKEAEIPVWRIVAEKPTFSKFPPHSVCHTCASQIFFYEKTGNYLKIVRRRRHWRRSRFRKENRKFRISNIAKLGAPPK